MTKKMRYFLLILGFAAFCAMAPVIVLYTRGISFDLNTNSFVPTGIIAIAAEPADLEVFLDGKLTRTDVGDIRFIKPGEYYLELKKQGYHPWTKRLSVTAGQVTWANPAFNSIRLFFADPKIQELANGVMDFFKSKNEIVYLSKDKLTVAAINDLNKSQSYDLKKKVDQILLSDSENDNFVLTGSGSEDQAKQPSIIIFNRAEGKTYDITGLFNSVPQMQFGHKGELYALSEQVLFKVDFKNKSKSRLIDSVGAFYWLENNLYLLSFDQTDWSISTAQDPFVSRQILLKKFPELGTSVLNSIGPSNTRLFVTFEKQIFVLSRGSMYLAGDGFMQKLAGNVSLWNFDSENSILSVSHSGELSYYGAFDKGLNFVTRTAQIIGNPIINNSIGSAFFTKNNQIIQIEMDTRDLQNQSVIYNGKQIQKFVLDDDGKNGIVLDDGELKNLVIR